MSGSLEPRRRGRIKKMEFYKKDSSGQGPGRSGGEKSRRMQDDYRVEGRAALTGTTYISVS